MEENGRKEIKQRLIELREELRAALAISSTSAAPVELDQAAMGRVSRIDAIQQQKMIEAGREGQQHRLAQVEKTLLRIDDEDFGLCSDCEEAIDHRRLLARPESRLCVSCQAQREN